MLTKPPFSSVSVLNAMELSRLKSVLLLSVAVALGYFASQGFVQIFENPTNEPSVLAIDNTCSEGSPETATCIMPEEMSRANFLRLAAPAKDESSKEIPVERNIREAFPQLPIPHDQQPAKE
jgi:Tfp pilus assembly protein PilV